MPWRSVVQPLACIGAGWVACRVWSHLTKRKSNETDSSGELDGCSNGGKGDQQSVEGSRAGDGAATGVLHAAASRATPSGQLLGLGRLLRERHISDRGDALRLMSDLLPVNRPPAGCGLAIYPGSFNPPHNLHVRMAEAVCQVPGVDALWLDMTMHRSKKHYVGSVEQERVRMADVAVHGIEKATVTTVQGVMGDNGWTREYFDALRVFLNGGEASGASTKGKLFWVMGSDVVEAMQYYKEKATGLLNAVDCLIVFEREVHKKDNLLALVQNITGWSSKRVASFVNFQKLGPEDHLVSSSLIRRYIVSLLELVPLPVLQTLVADRHLLQFYQSLYKEEDVKSSIQATSQGIIASMKESTPRSSPRLSPAAPAGESPEEIGEQGDGARLDAAQALAMDVEGQGGSLGGAVRKAAPKKRMARYDSLDAM